MEVICVLFGEKQSIFKGRAGVWNTSGENVYRHMHALCLCSSLTAAVGHHQRESVRFR